MKYVYYTPRQGYPTLPQGVSSGGFVLAAVVAALRCRYYCTTVLLYCLLRATPLQPRLSSTVYTHRGSTHRGSTHRGSTHRGYTRYGDTL